jgi:hypothetical protein
LNQGLELNGIYTIQLCSGELRFWKYLGVGSGNRVWWYDIDTGANFNEESILYAWTIHAKSTEISSDERYVAVTAVAGSATEGSE